MTDDLKLAEPDLNRVLGYAGRLPEHHPVRRAAVELICRGQVSDWDALRRALEDPSASNWRKQLVAVWVLGRTTQGSANEGTATDLLCEALESTHRERTLPKLLRAMLRTLQVAAATALVYTLVDDNNWVRYAWHPPWFDIFFPLTAILLPALAPIVGPFSFWLDKRRRQRVRAEAAEALALLAPVKAIGPLAEATMDRDRIVSVAAARALGEILPGLTPEQYGVVPAHAVEALARALDQSNTQLSLCFLDALRKVGTSVAIPYVERLTTRGNSSRLRATAADVLQVLRERQQHEHLLRPSASGEAELARLLRPAGEVSTPAEALLRPAVGD